MSVIPIARAVEIKIVVPLSRRDPLIFPFPRTISPHPAPRFSFYLRFPISEKVKSKLNQVEFLKLFRPPFKPISIGIVWARLVVWGLRTLSLSQRGLNCSTMWEHCYFSILFTKRSLSIDKFHLHAVNKGRSSPTHAYILILLKTFRVTRKNNLVLRHTRKEKRQIIIPTFHALNGRNTNTIKSWFFMCCDTFNISLLLWLFSTLKHRMCIKRWLMLNTLNFTRETLHNWLCSSRLILFTYLLLKMSLPSFLFLCMEIYVL